MNKNKYSKNDRLYGPNPKFSIIFFAGFIYLVVSTFLVLLLKQML